MDKILREAVRFSYIDNPLEMIFCLHINIKMISNEESTLVNFDGT